MDREIYLDNNATTQLLPEVCEAIVQACGSGFGNPSSVHAAGDRGRRVLSQAREAVAALIGAQPDRVIFTSGGTESNNTVFASILKRDDAPKRVIVSSIEHSSILKTCGWLEREDVEIVTIAAGSDGRVDVSQLAEVIDTSTALVSIQWVNNETGVIQPVEQVAQLCQQHGVLFHTDAVQVIGKLDIDVESIPVDLLTLTAHKVHGPQGVGALYARRSDVLRPLLFGGDQEHGLRAGTENLPGIAGFGAAARLARQRLSENSNHVRMLRDRFEQRVFDGLPRVKVNGAREHRVDNTSNLMFEGVDGQALVARLDQEGVRCSQSSACTNQRPEPSYVLRAMGISEDDAYASVRFSFSHLNTIEDVDTAVDRIIAICGQLRGFCLDDPTAAEITEGAR